MRCPTERLRSLIVDGVIAGVGAVIVFLPQILILFLFILLLEATGYMVRAAFLMDQADARRGPVGPRLHPLAVELRLRGAGHHGDANDRRSEGPADDHPGRAADDLFGAAAGLHFDHRRLHSRDRRSGRASACRAWCCSVSTSPASSARLLAALVLRRTVMKGGGGAFMMELPKYQMPASEGRRHRAVAARRDLPQARRHDHPRHDDPAVGAGQLPAGEARAKSRSTYRSPARSPTASTVVVAPIGFNHDIALALAPGDGGARSRGQRHRAPSIRSMPSDEQGRQTLASRAAVRDAGRCRPPWPSSPGSCSRRNASRPSP